MDSIVKLNESHSGEIAALNRHLIEDEGHSNSMTADELENRMREWLSREYACFGVLRGQRILAYCLYKDAGAFFYIRQLFTVRDLRNRGLASTLLEYLERNVLFGKPIRLEVLVHNSEAQKFYESKGYKVYCHTLVKNV